MDDDLFQEIEEFRAAFKGGAIPMDFIIPYAIKLGVYYYKNGGRLPDIRLRRNDAERR
jgi:hypothetical protein